MHHLRHARRLLATGEWGAQVLGQAGGKQVTQSVGPMRRSLTPFSGHIGWGDHAAVAAVL